MLIPISEYLNTTFRPDCDYVDGELRERNMGEQQHSALQAFFAAICSINRASWGVRALPEQRVQTSASHYRVADVCIRRITDPADPIIRVPPLICIEILSRGDTLSEMQERVDDYLSMGVQNIWIIDPVRRYAWIAQDGGLHKPVGDALTVSGTPILIPLADIYAELDDLEAGR